MITSECCGAEPVLDSDDLGICPECKEHCEYVEPEECVKCGNELDDDIILCDQCYNEYREQSF